MIQTEPVSRQEPPGLGGGAGTADSHPTREQLPAWPLNILPASPSLPVPNLGWAGGKCIPCFS